MQFLENVMIMFMFAFALIWLQNMIPVAVPTRQDKVKELNHFMSSFKHHMIESHLESLDMFSPAVTVSNLY